MFDSIFLDLYSVAPYEIDLPMTLGEEKLGTVKYIKDSVCWNEWGWSDKPTGHFHCSNCDFEIEYEIIRDPRGPRGEDEKKNKLDYCPRCRSRIIPYIGK